MLGAYPGRIGDRLFTVSVETNFWASHQLTLLDGSKEPLHQHNWQVKVSVAGDGLNRLGLVMDFRKLKAMVGDVVAPFNSSLETMDYFRQNNSSAENVARYIYEKLEGRFPPDVRLYKVRVVEESGCRAVFRKQ
jgi:6-pyruvoyltetrahydropterin/6-carboxytetrahydropterin synthase